MFVDIRFCSLGYLESWLKICFSNIFVTLLIIEIAICNYNDFVLFDYFEMKITLEQNYLNNIEGLIYIKNLIIIYILQQNVCRVEE